MLNMDTPVITNARVAKDIGVTHSMVSRIRSGDRHPSFEIMAQIERAYNWTISDQAKARTEGKYAQMFEYRVSQHYAD